MTIKETKLAIKQTINAREKQVAQALASLKQPTKTALSLPRLAH